MTLCTHTVAHIFSPLPLLIFLICWHQPSAAPLPRSSPNAGQADRADLFPEYYRSGIAYLRAGQAEKAIQSLTQAVRLEPKSKPAHSALGQALIETGKPVDAIGQFRACTELDPADAQAHYDLGQAYLRLALVVAGQVLETDSASAYARRIFAQNYIGKGDFVEAETQYRLALKAQPDAVDLRLELANLFSRMGQQDKAREEYARARREGSACQASPGGRSGDMRQPANSNLEVGRRAYATRQYESAYGHFLEAQKSDPQNLAALYWLQESARRLAQESFDQVRQLDPDSFLIHLLNAQASEEQQQTERAIQEYKAAIDRRPHSVNARVLLGHLEWKWQKYDDALRDLLEALRLNPDEPAANYLVGDIWVQKHDPEKAMAYLNRSLALRPGFLNAEASLGRALGQLGRPRDAIDELTKVAAADADGAIHYQLYQLYLKLGNHEQANAALAAAQRLRSKNRDKPALQLKELP